MTPEQLELVQSSYASLGSRTREMANDFYGRLFAADPTTKELFTESPDVMATKFADELGAIVEAITSYETFAPRVRDLAARHVRYGVRTRHYQSLGDALIATLAEHLGPRWNAELEAAWRRAYNLVAELMMATAASIEA
jgi:hemoglobin-like flavoprotein